MTINMSMTAIHVLIGDGRPDSCPAVCSIVGHLPTVDLIQCAIIHSVHYQHTNTTVTCALVGSMPRTPLAGDGVCNSPTLCSMVVSGDKAAVF
jgi:hypothetical protein